MSRPRRPRSSESPVRAPAADPSPAAAPAPAAALAPAAASSLTPASSPAGLPLLLDRLTRGLGTEHVDTTAAPPHIRCAPRDAHEVREVLEGALLAGVRVSCDDAPAALLHLRLHRMTEVLSVDEMSQVCEVQAGITLLALEDALRPRGLTLGSLPAPSWRRTLGAALAAPRPAEASIQGGRLRDQAARVYGVLVDVGARRELALPVALSPRRAAGPDLKQVLVGGRGRTGVITSVSVVARRLPTLSRCAGWLCPDAPSAMAAVLAILRRQSSVGPAEVQVLSREQLVRIAPPGAALPRGETAIFLRAAGAPGLAETELLIAGGICAAASAHALPEEMAQEWLTPGHPDRAAALWPAHQQALPPSSAEELSAAFDRVAGPRVLCGVHLLGAALCTEVPLPAAPETDATRLFAAITATLDPRQLLC